MTTTVDTFRADEMDLLDKLFEEKVKSASELGSMLTQTANTFMEGFMQSMGFVQTDDAGGNGAGNTAGADGENTEPNAEDDSEEEEEHEEDQVDGEDKEN